MDSRFPHYNKNFSKNPIKNPNKKYQQHDSDHKNSPLTRSWWYQACPTSADWSWHASSPPSCEIPNPNQEKHHKWIKNIKYQRNRSLSPDLAERSLPRQQLMRIKHLLFYWYYWEISRAIREGEGERARDRKRGVERKEMKWSWEGEKLLGQESERSELYNGLEWYVQGQIRNYRP